MVTCRGPMSLRGGRKTGVLFSLPAIAEICLASRRRLHQDRDGGIVLHRLPSICSVRRAGQMRLLDEADDLKLLRCGGASCLVSPIPGHAFFEQPQFECARRQSLQVSSPSRLSCLTSSVVLSHRC